MTANTGSVGAHTSGKNSRQQRTIIQYRLRCIACRIGVHLNCHQYSICRFLIRMILLMCRFQEERGGGHVQPRAYAVTKAGSSRQEQARRHNNKHPTIRRCREQTRNTHVTCSIHQVTAAYWIIGILHQSNNACGQ